MTGLKETKIDFGDLLKAALAAGPVLVTLGTAIWAFSTWTERVNMRLDDIDRDLKTIHEHYDHEPPLMLVPPDKKSTLTARHGRA